MRRIPVAIRIWCLCLLVCSAAVVAAFRYADVPVVRMISVNPHHARTVSRILAGSVLIGLEAAVILLLISVRLARGRLSPFLQVLVPACATSIAAYAINATVLKVIFGVAVPRDVLKGASHAFNWLAGSDMSSFPSGHMMLAAAFAGVVMRVYRQSIVPLAALLAIAAAMLLLGHWHFPSDLIAGTFLGLSAGLAVGQVWLVRKRRSRFGA